MSRSSTLSSAYLEWRGSRVVSHHTPHHYNLHVFREIKFEVELPATDAIRHLTVLVEEGKSNLDDLQKINVTPDVNPALVVFILTWLDCSTVAAGTGSRPWT